MRLSRFKTIKSNGFISFLHFVNLYVIFSSSCVSSLLLLLVEVDVRVLIPRQI